MTPKSVKQFFGPKDPPPTTATAPVAASTLADVMAQKKTATPTVAKSQTVFGTTGVAARDIQFAIVDETGQDRAWLARIATALTKQTQFDFDLPPPIGYGITAVVRLAQNRADVKPGEWTAAILPKPDQAGALGYHDHDPAGNPLIKIFPSVMTDVKKELSVTLSHEVLETLGDATCNTIIQAPDGKLWAAEICDAVEQDQYLIDGIQVSNFITWGWFGGLKTTRYDFMGLCRKPYEVRPGGYSQFLDPKRGWQQILNGQRSPYRDALARQAAGRGAARAAWVTDAVNPARSVPKQTP